MQICLVAAAALIAFCGVRMFQTKMHAGELSDQLKAQKGTLAELRRTTTPPLPASTNSHVEKDAVSRLQLQIERSAKHTNCLISEFQASPEPGPYLSVFTADTNHPDWLQVSIHLTLEGTLASTLATVEGFRKGGIPLEPDSLEIMRQSPAPSKGPVKVELRLAFRVLIKPGGTA
jgi:hypothetical protein